MTVFFTALPRHNCLSLTVSMLTCLILLINVSFKIIVLYDVIFTVNSILCPVIAAIYLGILKKCSLEQQRHILNQSLLALYLFSIGIFLLVNLPAAEYMHDNPAYQIVFEDIPKKFFASTIAFALSFYLPHLFCHAQKKEVLSSPPQSLLLALVGGFLFFTINFLLLFSGPHEHSFARIYWNSLLVSAGILTLLSVFYMAIFLPAKPYRINQVRKNTPFYLTIPLYHYLISFSVTILLICLACEYRLVSFSNGFTIGASGLLFPLTTIVSNLIGELFGYKANLRLAVVLILAELVFDLLLMGAIALPAPEFFNLNPFYSVIMPRRISAGTLALFVTFVGNAMLLENLKYASLQLNSATRILIANFFSSSLLCLVNYTLLYGGIYPYEQIFNLAISAWVYKLIISCISLPLILRLSKRYNKAAFA